MSRSFFTLVVLISACQGNQAPAANAPPAAAKPGETAATTPPSAAAAPATTPPATAEPAKPAGEGSVNPTINDRYKTPEGRAKSQSIFEDPERAAYQKPDELMKAFGLKSGQSVADIAAGTGYMEERLSKAVGAKGKVYAEDIQPEFLDEVTKKVKENKLKNVEVVLGTEKDAKLPAACCDVAIILDAYHHFEYPKPMMDSIKQSLKPGGKLIIVEFHRRQNDLFDKFKIDAMKHVRLDFDGAVAELKGLGWKMVETKDFLPWQWYAVFTPEAP